MKLYLLIFSVLFTFSNLTLFAQQNKLLTHFIFDKMSVNPGATGVGMSDGICGTSIFRNQWNRVAGAPNSGLLNAEGNFSRYFNGGVGMSFYHDAIGNFRQNNLVLNYSYHLELGDGLMGIGLGLGMVSYGVQGDWLTPDDNPDDPSLPQQVTEVNLDGNFGVYYLHNKGWYGGISSTHIPAAELDLVNVQTARHYFLMGGYRYNKAFDVEELALDFNAMARTEFIEFSYDLNVRAIWDNMFWGGMTFRADDAIGLMAGIEFKNFIVGYSYDISTNALATVSRGSHEILFKYCYLLPPPAITKSRNPRYL